MTVEQVVSQLQQEILNLRAQGTAQSGLSDAVRAINTFATVQARKDTPSLIDVQGLGRPKAFSDKEIFSTVVEEDGGVLCWCDQGVRDDFGVEWSAEHVTEITTELTDVEFLSTSTIGERGVHNLEFVLWRMHTALMALTSCEASDIVANSRNPLEARRMLLLSVGTPSRGRTTGILRVRAMR